MANANLKVSLQIVVEGKIYYHATNININSPVELEALKTRFITELNRNSLASLEHFNKNFKEE